MTLAPFVRIVARGAGRARSLTLPEAQDAMGVILSGKAAPEAVGALLMVLRLRGETAQEIAGFTAALRAHVSGHIPPADLDWPSYAAGRSRGAPLFLLAARLVAQAGFRVSMHGWNSHQATSASVRDAIDLAGPQVRYDPLETLCPAAFDLLNLRDTFGLRSCINTVLRMWNPSKAPVSVQGVFHPSYRGLQTRAAELLGQRDLAVIKGGGGEFERHPSKDIAVFGLRHGRPLSETAPACLENTRRLHDINRPVDARALWFGSLADPFAVATVTGTAGLALRALDAAPTQSDADNMACALWAARHSSESRTA
ncbi:glycosyl transferase family protein [Pseudooctadecabacter sp.]|uniref:glycosyl transferase family protein n=1 Tax=Pseudooctadecabacter sp. TaxID=1966338 RepID=UPI0025E723FD|nr:glycosyl transferase family protein [Pseudooctadecabacter sp.]